MYESKPYYFADSGNLFRASAPLTYATIYRNQVWKDWLIPVANMSRELRKTSLEIRAPKALGLEAQGNYLLFDTHLRTARRLKGSSLNQAFGAIAIPAESLQLFCLRQLPAEGAYHVWGGKRISEVWNGQKRKLTLTIQGPAGLEETLFLGCVNQGIAQVNIGGKREPFFSDAAQGLVHGKVTFTSQPLKVEVLCGPRAANGLPEGPVPAGPLAHCLSAR